MLLFQFLICQLLMMLQFCFTMLMQSISFTLESFYFVLGCDRIESELVPVGEAQ